MESGCSQTARGNIRARTGALVATATWLPDSPIALPCLSLSLASSHFRFRPSRRELGSSLAYLIDRARSGATSSRSAVPPSTTPSPSPPPRPQPPFLERILSAGKFPGISIVNMDLRYVRFYPGAVIPG